MEKKKTIQFVSPNNNLYTIILEEGQISLLDKWYNIITHQILHYSELDKEKIEDFITDCVDGIGLDREQEHDLVRFIYGLYPMHLLDKNEMTYQRY